MNTINNSKNKTYILSLDIYLKHILLNLLFNILKYPRIHTMFIQHYEKFRDVSFETPL